MRQFDIYTMIKMQEALNEVYIPGWRNTLTVEDYATQIVDEASELLRSGYQYKWWKNEPFENFNHWNACIEVVDIIFFYMSMVSLDLGDHVESLRGLKSESTNNPAMKISNTLNRTAFIDVLSAIFNQVSTGVSHFDVVDTFTRLGDLVGIDQETISAIYVVKYALNEFRISSGYKTGLYKKVVDGVEDNERLKGLVEKFLVGDIDTLDNLKSAAENSFFIKT